MGPDGRHFSRGPNPSRFALASSDTLIVTVNNVAPTASIVGPASGVRGQARTFTFGASDASAADQAANFTFAINWGDGINQQVTGPPSQALEHLFTAAGTYTVQVTATDKNGAVSAVAQQSILIKAVDLQAGTLAIGGTTASDTITVTRADTTGNLAVSINGVSQGTFASPAQILVYGQAGDDSIKVQSKKIQGTTYYVTAPAILLGEAGNDTLDVRGSTANNILSGGTGTDSLLGGSGRDLLFGGIGADSLRGSDGDDLLVAAATDHDANLVALTALMAEWGRASINYATRINHLNGTTGGGLNGDYFLNASTVHDDNAIDQLYGDAGTDWFFAKVNGSNKDKVNSAAGETITTL